MIKQLVWIFSSIFLLSGCGYVEEELRINAEVVDIFNSDETRSSVNFEDNITLTEDIIDVIHEEPPVVTNSITETLQTEDKVIQEKEIIIQEPKKEIQENKNPVVQETKNDINDDKKIDGLKLQADAEIYDGEKIIGLAKKDTEFKYEYKDNEYFYIKIENYLGKIKISDTIQEAKIALPEIAGNKKENRIYTVKETQITDKNGAVLVEVPKNRRYEYIRKENNNYVVNIGGLEGYINANNVAVDKGVPVLMYHAIETQLQAENINKNTYISTKQFKENMDYLKQNGYETITVDDFYAYMEGKKNLSKKSVVITFDDGILEAIELTAPILKNNSQKATQFIITSRTDNPRFASEETFNKYKNEYNFEGHTHALHNLVDNTSKGLLTTKTKEELLNDFKMSKNVLPEQKYLAYPFGQYTGESIEALKELGYKMAFVTATGYANKETDYFLIPRFEIRQSTSIKEFEKIVSGQK